MHFYTKMALPLLACILSYSTVSAQTSTTEKKKDSSDLPHSHFDASLGWSNGYFTPKSGTQTAYSQSLYTAGLGYTDLSGFTISALGMLTQDKGMLTLYQTAVTPGFEFNKGKTWGGGISYTRYLNKDSVSFELSPLKNEFYGYLTYKRGVLSPTLALNYATGTEKDVLVSQRRTVTRNTSIYDFSMVLSVKHEFELGSVFSDKDGFSFTPSVIAVTGTNGYGANLLGGKIPRFTSNKRAARLASGGSASSFQWQYLSFNLDFSYSIGKFYIEPQVLFDYTIPQAESQWNSIFSLGAGISF